MAKRKDQPTDQDVLDVILPILRNGKLAGHDLTVTGKKAEAAVLARWPGIGIKTARRKVTRLRIL